MKCLSECKHSTEYCKAKIAQTHFLKFTTMATGGNRKRQRKEPRWYELCAKGWMESDSETDDPQEVRNCIHFV